jgi:hypothetical protein
MSVIFHFLRRQDYQPGRRQFAFRKYRFIAGRTRPRFLAMPAQGAAYRGFAQLFKNVF